MKLLTLSVMALTLCACATPPVTTYTAADGSKFTMVGQGSLMEDADYEEQENLFKLPGLTVRQKVKKHGKDQQGVPKTWITADVTKFLAGESTKVADSNNARDVDLGAQSADVAKTKLTPTIVGPEETAVFAP
jgi:hypothetical protein